MSKELDYIAELERENRLLGERCNQLLKDKGDLTDKIADIKANCDLAIEGRDIKIKELEKDIDYLQKCKQKIIELKEQIKNLKKENAELKKENEQEKKLNAEIKARFVKCNTCTDEMKSKCLMFSENLCEGERCEELVDLMALVSQSDLQKENEQLKQQIEKMKRHCNCKHRDSEGYCEVKRTYLIDLSYDGCDKWELED